VIAKEAMLAGKHVFLEKPIAMELSEADELIAIRREEPALHDRLLAALQPEVRVREALARGRHDRRAGERARQPHITRNLGKKISGASSCRPRRWSRRTTSISCCGASRRATDPRLRAGGRQDHEGAVQRARLRLDDRHHGRRHRVHGRRRLGAAAGYPNFSSTWIDSSAPKAR
jgi:hypothetical protein